ncbi:MAG: CapA family protein [Alphaproteobacteria bacterium]
MRESMRRRLALALAAALACAACAPDGPRAEEATATAPPGLPASVAMPGAMPAPGPAFVDCDGREVPVGRDELRVAATGDIVLAESEPVFRESFAPFLPVLRGADLVLGNLEGAITTSDNPAKPSVPGRSFVFRFPPEVAGVLKDANFHVLSIANNHVFDYGAQGFSDTLAHLSAAGIRATGMRDSRVVREARGLRIGVVALAHYPVFNNVLEVEASARLVSALRGDTDLVLVYYQLGAEGDGAALLPGGPEEFLGEARGDARAFAAAMVAAGAGALVGHGPHVMRAAECIGGVPVLHSVGNFVGGGRLRIHGLPNVAALPELAFDAAGRFRGARLHAVTFAPDGNPRPDRSARAISLVNWLGAQARETMRGFSPIAFRGAEDHEEAFHEWFRGTTLGGRLQAMPRP